MPKFLVENLTDKPVDLSIEPWADLEILAPNERVEFEYQEPAEISFAFTENGGGSVSISSDRIKVIANRSVKLFRQPPGWESG